MDLSAFETKTKSEAGIWEQIEIHGKKIPVFVLIYGEDSNIVKAYTREKVKRLTTMRTSIAEGEQSIEDLDLAQLDTTVEDAAKRTGGFKSEDGSPVTMFDTEIGDDIESFKKVYESIPEIKDFVLSVSKDRARFLSGGKEILKKQCKDSSSSASRTVKK